MSIALTARPNPQQAEILAKVQDALITAGEVQQAWEHIQTEGITANDAIAVLDQFVPGFDQTRGNIIDRLQRARGQILSVVDVASRVKAAIETLRAADPDLKVALKDLALDAGIPAVVSLLDPEIQVIGDQRYATVSGGFYPDATVGPFSGRAGGGFVLQAPVPSDVTAEDAAAFLTPPLTVELAERALPGTEMVFRATAKAEFDASLPIPIGQIDASGSIGTQYMIRVEKRADNKVFVNLTERDNKEVRGAINLDASIADLTPADRQLLALGSYLFEGTETSAILAHISRLTEAAVSLRAGISISDKEFEGHGFEIDLNTEAGKEAYQKLMTLNVDGTHALAAETQDEVRSVSMNEHLKTTVAELGINVFDLELLRRRREKNEVSGQFTNSEGQNIRWISSEYKRKTGGLFSPDANMSAEMVYYSDRPGQLQPGFAHFTYDRVDNGTDKDEIRSFVNLAYAFGALESLPTEAQIDELSELYGASNRAFDIYVTAEGLEKFANATSEELMVAFTNVYLRAEPDNTEGARIIMPQRLKDKYDTEAVPPAWTYTGEFRNQVQNGRRLRDMVTDRSMRGREVQENERTYRSYTKRDLRTDRNNYKELKDLTDRQDDFKSSRGNPNKQIDAILRKGPQIDRYKSLAVVAMLAGPENVHVSDIRLEPREGAQAEGPWKPLQNEGPYTNPISNLRRFMNRLAA